MINKITEIMESHKADLFRYAVYRIGDKEDAEDLLQNVYLQLAAKASTLRKIKNLSNYIFICVVNACNKFLREKEQEQSRLIDYSEHLALDGEYASIDSFEVEFAYYNRLLAQLPEEQSDVIRLKIYTERNFDDIAEILNIPTSTAKTRFYLGLNKLKDILKS